MNKIAQYACFGIAGLLSCTAYAVDTVTDSSPDNGVFGMMLADTRGMDRRDDRQDAVQDNQGDREDCRQEEGAGHDKRDCKQDERQDDRHGNDDDNDA